MSVVSSRSVKVTNQIQVQKSLCAGLLCAPYIRAPECPGRPFKGPYARLTPRFTYPAVWAYFGWPGEIFEFMTEEDWGEWK